MTTAQAAPSDIEALEKSAASIHSAAGLDPDEWPASKLAMLRKIIAPELNISPEFLAAFVSVCSTYKFNPLLGQLYVIDTKAGPKIVTGRETFIEVANRHPEFEGMDCGVVREGDQFGVIKSGGQITVEHSMGLERGKRVTAYCVAYRKGHMPVAVLRRWKDYSHLHKKDNWVKYGDDMLETRAIVAALRRQFPIPGIYEASEFGDIDAPANADPQHGASQSTAEATKGRLNALKERMKDDAEVADAEVVEDEEQDVSADLMEAAAAGTQFEETLLEFGMPIDAAYTVLLKTHDLPDSDSLQAEHFLAAISEEGWGDFCALVKAYQKEHGLLPADGQESQEEEPEQPKLAASEE